MTICPSCGFRNEDSDAFCRNPACGAFQGWKEEPVPAERRPRPPAGADADAAEGPRAPDAPVGEDTQPFDPTGTGPIAPPEPPAADPWFRAAAAEPETTADPFATGPFAPGRTWRSEWRGMDSPRPDPPTRRGDRSDDWERASDRAADRERAAPSPLQGGGADSPPWPGGVDRDGVGRDPERRVLSAAEAAWGTRDFVHRPDAPEPDEAPAPGVAPRQAPPETQEPPLRTARPADQRRAPEAAWPPAGASQPFSFPSQEQLLKQPPWWERLLRRTPIPLPGEGRLRRAPSARDRERQRALLRFGALVLVILLVGGGMWLASGRDKPAGVATSGAESPQTTASPKLTRVRPSRVVASTESGSRVATNVLDGNTDTFWSRLVPSDDDQPFLRFFFDGRVRLARVAIASGASGAEFSLRPRPRQIELRFSDKSTVRTTLADRRGFQRVDFSPREVNAVRLVILSTYPSAGPQRTSISEVRFAAVKG